MKRGYLNLLNLSSIINDTYIKSKLKKYTFLVIIFSLIILLIIVKPLTKLKAEFNYRLANPKGITLYPEYKNIARRHYNTKYIYPANGQVTSEYGYRRDPITGVTSFHTGVDISCYTHRDNILAVADGTITFVGSQNGYGYCIEIRHDFSNETVYSFYAHLSNINVSEGQQVLQGDVIGNEGGDPYSDPNPGYSTGHHLHFELRNASGYGNHINPDLGV